MNVPSYPVTQGRALRSCELGRFRVTESRYAPEAAIPKHSHEAPSIAIAVRGSFVESLHDRDIECAPFDALVKPAGEVHANRYGRTGASCLLIEADAHPAAIFSRTAHVRSIHLAAAAARLHEELAARDDAWQIAVEGALLDLVATLCRASNDDVPYAVRRACEFIEAHWNAKMSLADIARAAGVHRSTLVRAFRVRLRCSPAEYIRRLRLEHAETELRRGEKSIAEIALECGFYDQSHFTNAFRRFRGVTPRALLSGGQAILPVGPAGQAGLPVLHQGEPTTLRRIS